MRARFRVHRFRRRNEAGNGPEISPRLATGSRNPAFGGERSIAGAVRPPPWVPDREPDGSQIVQTGEPHLQNDALQSVGCGAFLLMRTMPVAATHRFISRPGKRSPSWLLFLCHEFPDRVFELMVVAPLQLGEVASPVLVHGEHLAQTDEGAHDLHTASMATVLLLPA